MMARQRRGFTLIELLVVMAIIAIAATLIGPLAVNQYDRSKQTAERETLLRLLNHFTFTAYSRNQSYTLVTDEEQMVLYQGTGPRAATAATEDDQAQQWTFEYLRFPQQEIRLNRHGFWQPNLIEWLEGEREMSTELNMQLIESGGSDAPLE